MILWSAWANWNAKILLVGKLNIEIVLNFTISTYFYRVSFIRIVYRWLFFAPSFVFEVPLPFLVLFSALLQLLALFPHLEILQLFFASFQYAYQQCLFPKNIFKRKKSAYYYIRKCAQVFIFTSLVPFPFLQCLVWAHQLSNHYFSMLPVLYENSIEIIVIYS